ncbi:MAG: hypothetical protein WCC59_01915, partial [Terriglobales bacterium]
IEGEMRNLELEEAVKRASEPQILPPEHTVPVVANAGETSENPHPVSPNPGETRVGQPEESAAAVARHDPAPAPDVASAHDGANLSETSENPHPLSPLGAGSVSPPRFASGQAPPGETRMGQPDSHDAAPAPADHPAQAKAADA